MYSKNESNHGCQLWVGTSGYSYAEWTQMMHDIQDQYSHLADIESIGKSRMGRDQFLITVTAKSTGAHDTKPAMWVDGAVHGNEVNGIMCSLYLMWYLLTRYDYDPFVHDLVNSTTFYILPGLNVDANASFVEFPNNPNNPNKFNEQNELRELKELNGLFPSPVRISLDRPSGLR
mgnify:CR=1 FL=1